MRVFFNAVIIQIVLSAYIFWRGWQGLPDKKYIKIPYAAFYIIELVLYFVGFFGSHLLPFELLHDFAWLGTTWMVFIIYMTPLLAFYDLVKYIDKRKKLLPDRIDLYAKKFRLSYFCLSLLIVCSTMIYGNYKFYHPQVKKLTLNVDKYSSNLKNIKIVVVSDIHAGYLIDKDIISMYVDKIMEQKADLILLAGDIVDYDTESLIEQRMETEFRRLKAPYGVFAITGNHEYIVLDDEEMDNVTWLTKKSGFTLLRDSVVKVADSFYLVGREDDKFEERKKLKDIMKGVDTEFPVIVMNHEPHNLKEEVDGGADIALYGHTHNGQIFPNNVWMGFLAKLYNIGMIPDKYKSKLRFVYEVPYGYKKKGNTHIYVSSGLGLAGPQFRIGTESELVVLNVNFK